MNEGCTAVTGFKREDIIGKTSIEVNLWKNPADRQKLIDELVRIGFATGGVWLYIYCETECRQ
jgi:hypothetical protein